ncbi:unnamed protein product [Calicophoron daubneyi]|uniref:Trafficking protein particle complex subunit 13 n=1 Tax=Calicophoron daubneyi TaxID=300641 RepID=A0AAV2T3P1_CALDB
MAGHATDVLSLRVMRLNRPTFVRQQCEPAELYIDDIAGSLTAADAGIRGDLDGAALHRIPVSNSLSDGGVITSNLNDGKQQTQELIRLKVGGPGELLSLPQSFGSAYLGETFSAHVNLHNESDRICYNIELKVSLHNRIEWITLSTTGTLTGASIPALPSSTSTLDSSQRPGVGSVDVHPGQSLNAVIHHELKELGMHTLRCVASYCLCPTDTPSTTNVAVGVSGIKGGPTAGQWEAPNHGDSPAYEPYTFQRLYKFAVNKPLDVKKTFSVPESDGSVFMEAHVQNLTSTPIFLERVVFEPSPHLTVIDLNEIGPHKSPSSCAKLNCLRPDDVRQFLYRLTPPPSAVQQLQQVDTSASQVSPNSVHPLVPIPTQQPLQQPPISAGRLDITWRSTMGERGRLQTSSLKYEIPNTGDIQVKATEMPATVGLEQPFQVQFELTNRSARHLDLMLDLRTLGTPVADTFTVPPESELESSTESSKQSDHHLTPLPPIVWMGVSTRRLGGLPPGRSMPLQLNMMATTPGLQVISGLTLHELSTDREYVFNDLAHVLVCVS